MNEDYLQNYLEKELETCKRTSASLNSTDSLRQKAKSLYDVPQDTSTVFCESGSIYDVGLYPPETVVAIPIFPYRTKKLFEENIGPIDTFIRLCTEDARIIPLIQYPTIYQGLDYLRPVFRETKPRAYFIRGAFVYAALLGIDSSLVVPDHGSPRLPEIDALMAECSLNHSNWLAFAASESECWEHRYRSRRERSDAFMSQLRDSLCYRYASVALCIGKESADEIIEIFDSMTAAKILLYLHIIFDHCLACGFGSHLGFADQSSAWRDFHSSDLGLLDTLRVSIVQELRLLGRIMPTSSLASTVNEIHPLRGIKLEDITTDQIEGIRVQISDRLAEYRRETRKVEHYADIRRQTLSLSLLLFGCSGLANEEVLLKLGSLASVGAAMTGAPQQISVSIATFIKRYHKANVGCYLVKSHWDRTS